MMIVAVLCIGSLSGALSSTLAPFVVGRALQGMAMGYILVREVAPAERSTGAVAAGSTTLGVPGALGLPLAAWIAEDYSWHDLFWLSAALAIVVVLTAVVVPHRHDEYPSHIGIVGLAIGSVSALVGVLKGSAWGWGSIVIMLVWDAYELRHHDLLFDLRTIARRPVLFTNLSAVLVGFAMIAHHIVVPQLLEMSKATGYGLRQSVLHAGRRSVDGARLTRDDGVRACLERTHHAPRGEGDARHLRTRYQHRLRHRAVPHERAVAADGRRVRGLRGRRHRLCRGADPRPRQRADA